MRLMIGFLRGFIITLALVILALFGYTALHNGQLALLPEKTWTPQSLPAAASEGDNDGGVWKEWVDIGIPNLEDTYFISRMDADMQTLYAGIYQGICNFQEEILLPEPVDEVTLNEIMWLISYDCPELFNISGDYSYFVRQNAPNEVFSIKPTYIMRPDEYETALRDVRNILSAWINQAGPSDYDKQRAVYAKLIETCSYEEKGTHAGTAYGALVLGKARCEGYSKALCMALRMAGMEAMILTGEAQPSQSNTQKLVEKHAWNMAKVGGNYYQMDATWDDAGDALSYTTCYAYFNLTDEEMYKSRSLDSIYDKWELPACTSRALNYHVQNNLFIKDGQDIRRKLHDLLIDAYEFDLPYVTGKLSTDAQLDELTAYMESWMQSWYEEMLFSSGTYSWLTYTDGRVFCIVNLTYNR